MALLGYQLNNAWGVKLSFSNSLHSGWFQPYSTISIQFIASQKLFSAMPHSFTLWIPSLIFGQNLKITAMQIYGIILCTEFFSTLPNLANSGFLIMWTSKLWSVFAQLKWDYHALCLGSTALFSNLESRSNFVFLPSVTYPYAVVQYLKTVTSYIFSTF